MLSKNTIGTFLAIASVLGLVTGIVIMIYLWKVLGERGMYADATGTGGYTTVNEVLLGLLGFVLLAGSIVGLLVRRKLLSKSLK